MSEQEKKKERVIRLSGEHPNLSRKGIADLVPCTPAFVTQTLGAKRAYKKRRTVSTEEKVVG